MASAAFSVNGADSPVAVVGGSVVNLTLKSVSGVGSVEWSILGGSDSTQTKPVITPSGSPPGAVASFTMNSPTGTLGVSWVVQCRINGGRDANKAPVAEYTQTALVGVLNGKSILPFAAFESFERNQTTGIADDLNQALSESGGAGSITPTFQDSFTSNSATAAVVRNIGLPDNAVTRVVVVALIRDQTNNWHGKMSSTLWTRASAGGAVQLGGENGPVPAGPSPSLLPSGTAITGMSIVANGNGVDIKYGGSGSVRTRGVMQIYVESIAIAAA